MTPAQANLRLTGVKDAAVRCDPKNRLRILPTIRTIVPAMRRLLSENSK